MSEYTDEQRSIMRANMGGRRRGGAGATPIDMQQAQAIVQRGGFMGFVDRVAQFVAPVWMGPGQPLPVAVPQDTPPRSWDYPVFYNYSVQPDAAKGREAGVTMYQLKMLGRQTHVALARERLKIKQKKKRWSFGLERLPGETAHTAMLRAADDARVKIVSDFFRLPDGENELPEWLGLNLENIITCGVTSIVPWRKVNGQPFRLEVYDPATIVPKLDSGGRRPMGIDPETGETAVAFQQYIKGVPYGNFSDADMLWYGPNPVPGKVYPVGPTEQLLLYINIALRKDVQRLGQYTDGNIPAGLIPLPTTWTPAQIREWYNDFNNFVVNIPENLVKMVPIPYAGAGAQPIFPAHETLKDGWEETWMRLVFGFLSVPVSNMLREMTKANAEGNRNQADEEGEQYYEDVCRRLINRTVAKFFGWADVVARTESEVEMDLKKQSEIDKTRVTLGLDQPNEIRERDGKTPLMSLYDENDEPIEGYFNASGDFVPFGSMTVTPVSATDASATGGVAPQGGVAEDAAAAVLLNGAQVTAATAIVVAVALGDIPRDSGIGQLIVLFNLTQQQAEIIMGSAGTDTPTTPNPRPESESEAVDVSSPMSATAPLSAKKLNDAQHIEIKWRIAKALASFSKRKKKLSRSRVPMSANSTRY